MKLGISADRIISLSDSVFAVALTLLVLNVSVPIMSSFSEGGLIQELMNLWPKIIVYASTFFVIGVFWIGHRVMFHYIELVNIRLMCLNNLLLLFICFIPFSANLIGTYPWTLSGSVVYGLTLFVCSIFYLFVWKYAVHKKFIKSGLEEQFIKKSTRALFVAPSLYVISIALAFFSPIVSFFLFVITPILYILPGPIDELLPEKIEN